MGKYEALAEQIIKNVGGAKNINSLTHCVTRLRFQLNDESKANDDVLKNMDGVVTVMKSGGQYQVVIGNHVPEVYADVCALAGISGESQGPGKKMTFGALLLDFISGVMMPSMAILTASGMLKGILAIVAFMETSGTITGWTGTGFQVLLAAISDAMFFFLPIIVGYNVAIKMKISGFLGMIIGAALCYPTLQGVDLNFFGYVVNVTYTSTILPVIFTTIVAAWIYKGLIKVIPDVIKTFVVPMLVMAIAIPLGFLAIGPVSNQLSALLGQGIDKLFSFSPILAGFVLGTLWQPLVVLGIHMGIIMVAIVPLLSGQTSLLMATIGFVSFAQTAAVFVIWLRTKNKKLKDIALPAWVSGIFGVTEPAIYGVTLPRIKVFIVTCLGGGVAGAYLAATNTVVYAMSGMGIFSVPGYLGGGNEATAMFNVFVAIMLAIAIGGLGTWFLYNPNEDGIEGSNKKSNEQGKVKKDVLVSPIKGEVQPLSNSQDAAFAGGALGKGVVIVPTEGKVVSPVSGTVTVLFPTLHAVGITGDNGVDVLVHIGIDTVQLEGKGFKAHVKQGDRVEQGQLLVEFDRELITSAGLSLQSPVVITNSNDLLDVVIPTDKDALAKGEFITVLY